MIVQELRINIIIGTFHAVCDGRIIQGRVRIHLKVHVRGLLFFLCSQGRQVNRTGEIPALLK